AGQGYNVCVITRGSEGEDEKGIRYVSVEKISEETAGADVIINLAGENISRGRWTGEQKERIPHSRINTGLKITETLKKSPEKPELLIQMSATGFYGDRGDEYITENSGRGRGFLADICENWENSTKEAENMGVRRCVIRTGVVFGRGGFLKKIEIPFRFFAGSVMGSGKQYMPWIHIDDLVSMFDFLIKNKDASGVYNACAPEPLTNRDFSKALAAALKRPCFFRLPAFILKIMFGQMAGEAILSGARTAPKRLLEKGFSFRYTDAPKALEEVYQHT
ncbi:MAG TPA: TIGR01777 family protein, partial [Firmicutes bacterium]|nr:TIGR01777 family protein [Bacillota bacterium]